MHSQVIEKDQLILLVTKKVKEILDLNSEINIDTDLIGYGLDSLASVNLIVGLEEMFNIVIDEEEMLIENFTSVSKITNLIYFKKMK